MKINYKLTSVVLLIFGAMTGNAQNTILTKNVGIGVSSPTNALSIFGRLGIRADAAPTTVAETMRIEGAISAEENILNISNLVDQDFVVRLSAQAATVKRAIIGPSVQTRFSLGVGLGGSTANEYLTLLYGGNVGIGTVAPSSRFEVDYNSPSYAQGIVLKNSGNGVNGITDLTLINDTNQASALFFASSTYNTSPAVRPNSLGLSTGSSGGLAFLSASAGAPITFATTGVVNMIIKDNGNVGIGTTSPAGALAVNWSANTNGLGPIIHNSNTGSTALTDITFLNDANQFGNIAFSSSNYYAPGLTRPNTFGMSTSSPGGLVFLSTAAGAPITFQSTSVVTSSTIPAMTIKDGGNIGIGTTSPLSKLEMDYSANSYGQGLSIRNLNGGSGGLADVLLTNDTGAASSLFYASSTYSGLAGVRPNSMGINTAGSGGLTLVSTATGAPITFSTTGSIRMTIKDNGNIGIGSANPDALLAVNGTIHGKEVKVDLSVPGPDYVFEKGYQLPSLEKVEQYVNDNHHLAEIPSATEMEKNGVNLSEMNMLLLKKMEELTLYIIQQEKRIAELEQNQKNR